jgi:hypothetical protein
MVGRGPRGVQGEPARGPLAPHGTVATRAPPAPLDATRTARKLASIEEGWSGRASWERSDAANLPARRVTNCVRTGPHAGVSQRTMTGALSWPTCSDAQGGTPGGARQPPAPEPWPNAGTQVVKIVHARRADLKGESNPEHIRAQSPPWRDAVY